MASKTILFCFSHLYADVCHIQHQHTHDKDSSVTYWFYDALGTGEHGAHDGEVLGVRHPPLAHIFEDFSCWWSFQRVFGIEANIGVDACCENTESSSEDEPCGEENVTDTSTDLSNKRGTLLGCSPLTREISQTFKWLIMCLKCKGICRSSLLISFIVLY